MTPTTLLYLDDSYATTFHSTVVAIEGHEVALAATLFYPTGGGQPHDLGALGQVEVSDVRKREDVVWHTVAGHTLRLGDAVTGCIDWDRRHRLMRTHTALHVLCGVIWKQWRVPVTGGNMEPLVARMDFEFDPLPEGFAAIIETLVNKAIALDHQILVGYLPRSTAVLDEDLIRTKVNMIPDSVPEIRVVDIVGLDKQADGGTHVRSTREVGHLRVTKTESKGKGNKRIRVEIYD